MYVPLCKSPGCYGEFHQNQVCCTQAFCFVVCLMSYYSFQVLHKICPLSFCVVQRLMPCFCVVCHDPPMPFLCVVSCPVPFLYVVCHVPCPYVWFVMSSAPFCVVCNVPCPILRSMYCAVLSCGVRMAWPVSCSVLSCPLLSWCCM